MGLPVRAGEPGRYTAPRDHNPVMEQKPTVQTPSVVFDSPLDRQDEAGPEFELLLRSTERVRLVVRRTHRFSAPERLLSRIRLLTVSRPSRIG